MGAEHERWTATGTAAVVVASISATWAVCENDIAWRDTFRIEDIAAARGTDADFEAYRPVPLDESLTAWVAVILFLLAVAVVAVAGLRARGWDLTPTVVGAVCVVAVVGTGVVLPFGPLVLLVGAFVATMTLRDFARPMPLDDRADLTS